jgi:hypothetical protein
LIFPPQDNHGQNNEQSEYLQTPSENSENEESTRSSKLMDKINNLQAMRLDKQKTIQCTLLGDVVNIPKAPFALANILKKPVIVFYPS